MTKGVLCIELNKDAWALVSTGKVFWGERDKETPQ